MDFPWGAPVCACQLANVDFFRMASRPKSQLKDVEAVEVSAVQSPAIDEFFILVKQKTAMPENSVSDLVDSGLGELTIDPEKALKLTPAFKKDLVTKVNGTIKGLGLLSKTLESAVEDEKGLTALPEDEQKILSGAKAVMKSLVPDVVQETKPEPETKVAPEVQSAPLAVTAESLQTMISDAVTRMAEAAKAPPSTEAAVTKAAEGSDLGAALEAVLKSIAKNVDVLAANQKTQGTAIAAMNGTVPAPAGSSPPAPIKKESQEAFRWDEDMSRTPRQDSTNF